MREKRKSRHLNIEMEPASRRTLKTSSIWTRFFVKITLVILLFVAGVYIGLLIKNTQLLQNEVLARSRADFQNIVLTRQWNADCGGVYVEKTESVESNPYLKNPDIETVDGRVFTKKNPALMTREISELAEGSGAFSFRIASLRPVNPKNSPDEFETEALKLFELGTKEFYGKESIDGRMHFRYIAPLFMEKSCLQCHEEQGYAVGEVRGGISVQFDIDDMERSRTQNTFTIAVLGIVTFFLLLVIVYFIIVDLMRKLLAVQQRLEVLSMTDDLTGLHNRRHLFGRFEEEFERAKRYGKTLSCVMIDIDDFKSVNDRFGHQKGDTVLRLIADIIRSHSRISDTVARYGGEEFVMLLPETDAAGAQFVAEKVRRVVEERNASGNQSISAQVTVSLGIATVAPNDFAHIENEDELLRRADEALYCAKSAGKNRVCVYQQG